MGSAAAGRRRWGWMSATGTCMRAFSITMAYSGGSQVGRNIECSVPAVFRGRALSGDPRGAGLTLPG